MTTNLQELMNDMMEVPIIIHVCVVNYEDDSHRAYSFSTEEFLQEFIQYITEAGEEMGIKSYIFFETLLDLTCDAEYTMFGTVH